MIRKNLKKVISLYTGAGGLDYGVEAAGFDTAVAVEMDKWCCKTLRYNRDWPVIEDKIENVDSETILKTANLKKGEAGLLIGGPPCQPFSKAGYWRDGDAKRLNDPRSNTLNQYMRVLEDTLPHAFILENVFGLAYKGKDEGLRYLENTVQKINERNNTNYTFKWKVINTAHFGVSQIRERVFIIGSRDGYEFDFPEARFFPKNEDNPMLEIEGKTFRTAWDAIGDLVPEEETHHESEVGGKWGALLPSIPPGENYLYHTERGSGEPLFKWRSRYWSFLLKLHPDKPSWTIQAQPGTAIGPFHWNNRRLTMREMARIQTFPDDVEVLGGNSNVQKQIGNAVPSAIGELLGKEIRKQFFDERVSSKKLKLVPNYNEDKFQVNFMKRIPKEYRELIQ
ncbi:MAG: DNA cytosine methyltransferase [Bacteriovoracaceae bacterium]|nr:DNA cytosine methyltransferase [Bacteriovoracaceae bacterium]